MTAVRETGPCDRSGDPTSTPSDTAATPAASKRSAIIDLSRVTSEPGRHVGKLRPSPRTSRSPPDMMWSCDTCGMFAFLRTPALSHTPGAGRYHVRGVAAPARRLTPPSPAAGNEPGG